MPHQGELVEILERSHVGAFQSLRAEWDDLLNRSSGASVYQTWEWNEAWWRVFGEGKRLRLLEVRDAGRLVGLAPLYVSAHLGTPFRRLAFVGTGPSDYLDVLADDACAPAVAEFVLRHVTCGRGDDLADLQQLAPSAALLAAARGAMDAPEPRRMLLVPQEPCPYAALPGDWDAYASSLGKKMRGNLRYSERLLERSFGAVEYRLSDASGLRADLDDLFALHQSRWRARLLPGALAGARIRQFHRLVAERFAERGWLRLHSLHVDGRAVASLYCFRFRERYAYYLGGFCPELARFSLGTLLTGRAIRQAIEEGCSEFDFLRGDEPYKERWSTGRRTNHRLLLSHPRSWRSSALLRLNHLERHIERRAKAFAHERGRRRRP
jgi:CelD/BcsL family acetyltransferase involved in cellulose biosynthesis